MRNALAVAILVLVPGLLFVSACETAVPPVPTVSVDGVDPEVRDAVLTARKQAADDPSSGQASGRLGMVLHAHALYPPAVLAYERAIRLEPKEFAWRYYLALVHQQLRDPEKALAALSAALRIRSDYGPANLRKGDVLFQLGRLQESQEIYKSLLAADPGSAEVLYGLARAKYALNDLAAAEDLYSRALRAYPTFGAAYYGMAMAERGLGNEAESAKNFELAERFSTDHPASADPLFEELAALSTGVYYHLAKGDQLARSGRMDEAAKLNEAMLERDPENLAVLLNLLFLGRFVDRLDDKVEAFYSRAKQINPQIPLIYDYYGAVLVRQGKFDAAAAALRKALDLRPDYTEAHTLMAEVLERQNRSAEAIEHYQRALAAQSSDRVLQTELWRLLIIHGRSREAIPQLIPALQLDDSYAALRLVLLGEAYLTTGDVSNARQYLERARSRVLSQGPPQLLAEIEGELKQLGPRP